MMTNQYYIIIIYKKNIFEDGRYLGGKKSIRRWTDKRPAFFNMVSPCEESVIDS